MFKTIFFIFGLILKKNSQLLSMSSLELIAVRINQISPNYLQRYDIPKYRKNITGEIRDKYAKYFNINLRRKQWVILTHTPSLTENSNQVFQKKKKKKRDRSLTAVDEYSDYRFRHKQ